MNFTKLELRYSLSLWRYWIYRALIQFKLRYQNSSLGSLWPSISLVFVTLTIGTLWGTLLNIENKTEYYLYLMSGYALWPIISGSVEKGVRERVVRNLNGIPFITLVFEMAVRNALPLLFMSPIILASTAFLHQGSFEHVALLAGFIVLLNLWVIGVICTLIAISNLLPDMRHIVMTLMRLSFLATPIIWQLPRLGEYQYLIWFNPFFVPLEACRYALSGIIFEPKVLVIFPIYSIVMLCIGLLLLNLRIGKHS